MKVLVATRDGQGLRPDDFCFTLDGELVRLPEGTCSCPDCGCARGVVGLSSRSSTTTFSVDDRPALDVDLYRDLIRNDLDCFESFDGDEGEAEQWFDDYFAFHLEVAGAFDVGDILEVRDFVIGPRAPAEP